MNKILLFITIIFGSFFSLNAQSSASKPITNNNESRKAERFVLVINNLDKEGQFDAGKNYSWYLINVVSEDEKKVIEKMKIVLASYKPEIMETLNLKPGPEVGTVLDRLFEMVDSGEVKNEKEELQEALSAQIIKN